jgi:hypothetical protein
MSHDGWPTTPPGFVPAPPPGAQYITVPNGLYDVVARQPLTLPAVAPPPAAAKPTRVVDVETYRNYFLVKFYDVHTKQFFSLEFYDGKPLNVAAMLTFLRSGTNVTFNGINYDMVMISAAATGRFTNDMLKNLSDYVITTKPSPQPWMVARDWGFDLLDLDHIDLINVAPGQASLKIYGGRLHCKKMQDLPYKPDRILTREEMIAVERYCGNDLITTADLYFAVTEDLATRVELGEQYGIDVRSKSDAQIAEAAFRKLLGLDGRAARAIIDQAQLPPGFAIRYTPAPFLSFQTPELQAAYRMAQDTAYILDKGGNPQMPESFKNFKIRIGDGAYTLGIGGLHSTEKSVAHRAGNGVKLVDVDVVSYYPKIISILRMFPRQLGPVFLKIFDGWIEVRISYKTAGNKKKAATFKIKINGTYGKTGSRHSVLFSPDLMLRTTITGQFALLMLIEMLHLQGIAVVSANTDGVVIKTCSPRDEAVRDSVVKQWESMTGFETEANEYIGLFSANVNNYLAFKPAYTDKKGVHHPISVKAKGWYADDPISRLSKNPTNQICVDAVKEYIINGTPLEKTIRRCDDIRKFVTVRAVQGGGEWVKDTIIADTVGQKRAVLTSLGWTEESKGYWRNTSDTSGEDWQQESAPLDIAIKMIRERIPREYLGKAVRWYYGAGQTGHIAYAGNGNLVAKSEGAKPCMDLPDVLPPDINYKWYADEALSMLADLGISC